MSVCVRVCVCVCVCGLCNVWVFWQYVYWHSSATLTEVFPWFFLGCKANVRVKLAKTGHGQHSSKVVALCVVLLLFVLFYVLFVCKCVLNYCHLVSTQFQLTNISYQSYHIISYAYIISYYISYHKRTRNSERQQERPKFLTHFFFKNLVLFNHFEQYSQCMYRCLKVNGSSTLTQRN
jgi:hypothetical protein